MNVKVLVSGLYAVDPATLPPESVTTKLIVLGLTDSLNVAVMPVVVDAPVLAAVGVRAVTVGDVLSLPYCAA